MSSRREQRRRHEADASSGVNTRTGEVSPYSCPPRLLAPAVVEEWLTAEEIASRDELDALLTARRRWADARDAYALSIDDSTYHLRARVAQLCGPVSRPVWADERRPA
ncbi:hypothetical protein ACFYPK_07465 [Streptomyces halstedii]|uniref:hypothetical protein n=1 Tax=Streptomyces halstedii TaxID=1944 RepID=UPI0036933295